MSTLETIFILGAALILLIVLLSYLLFHLVFYVPNRNPDNKDYLLPSGKIYQPYHETMMTWMKNFRTFPHKVMTIQSFDGLTLYGNYYEYQPDAPIEIMFHGYRGTAERDLSVGIQRCFSMKRNALIIEQRASGRSQGNVISFGINEHRDCLSWIDFVISHFRKDTKIILTGISMGASTELLAAGTKLPDNVIYVLADCGYTSAQDIIKKCIRQIYLPANLLYPLIKFSAKLWGRFDLDESSPIEAMKNSSVPIVFIHGTRDTFVPCEMSQRNFDACQSEKNILLIPDAGHGISYLVDQDAYIKILMDFSKKYGLT